MKSNLPLSIKIAIVLFFTFALLEPDLSTRASVRAKLNRKRMAPVDSNNITRERGPLAGNFGFDISGQECDSWQPSYFTCLGQNGKDFAVIEAIQGGLGFTNQIAMCHNAAKSAGMYVSLYGFFCPNCRGNVPGNTTSYNLIKKLNGMGLTYTFFYVDVEDCDGCWNDHSSNIAYIRDVINGITAAGAQVAIYTSDYEWNVVTGGTTAFSNIPLWYANWDKVANFNDWYNMYGWTSPHMKQYYDHSDVNCGGDIDLDWFP